MAFIIVSAIVLARFARLGVADATTVFAAQRPADRSVLLSNLTLFALTGSIIVAAAVASLMLLADVRPAGMDRGEVLVLAAGTVSMAMIEANVAFLLGCGRIRQRAFLTAAGPWIYALMLGVAWLTGGLTVARAGLVWALALAVWAIWLFTHSVRGIGLAAPDSRLLLSSIRFGLRAWVGSLSLFLNFRADQILMGFIATQATLGIYAVAVNGSEILLYLPDATAIALLPFLARSDPGSRHDQTLRAFRALLLLGVVMVLVAAILGPVLLPLVFGEAFQASVVPFLLLLPGTVGFAALRVFSNALVASGSPGLSSVGPLASLGVGLALDLVLIPPFGATGAAAAATAAFLVGGLIALLTYRSREPFRWRDLLPRASEIEPEALTRPLFDEVVPPLLERGKPVVTRMGSVAWHLRRGVTSAGPGVRILYYHRVSADRDPLAVKPERFREQMEMLASDGYTVVDVVRAMEMLQRGEATGRVVGLTFDDGYLDVAENALPVLEKHGFSGTVFVVTGALEGKARFEWYAKQPPLLTWDDITALDGASALTFESHSVRHPNFLAIGEEDARRELQDSRCALESRLGRPVSAFCYPAGLFSDRERRLARECGYRLAVSCEPGINLPTTDPFVLYRTRVDPGDNLFDFRAKVAGGHDAPPLGRSIYRRLRFGAEL